jgi:geranylgeranyl pyrophosphate synthase
MDDDDLRRGKPTCHIKFGEATAILAGDALQTLAFQIIAETEDLSLPIRVRLITELARASGTPAGMVAGQALDLEAEAGNNNSGIRAEPQRVGDAELEQIHRYKTGALIVAAARCGAIIAEAKREELVAITEYAAQLGLLFQIADDLLDVTATVEAIGKTPGKDARASKATYASAYGVEAARDRAHEAHKKALAALSSLSQVSGQSQSSSSVSGTERLKAIADFILERTA